MLQGCYNSLATVININIYTIIAVASITAFMLVGANYAYNDYTN